MTDHILSEFSDGVLQVTINRPEKKNALTQGMYGALATAMNRTCTDPAVRVLHITGAGDAFTAGNDITDFAGGPERDADRESVRMIAALPDIPVPVVAAVNGIAVGVGVTMLLHFDVVLAAEEASFMTPFVDLGLVPEAASSMLIPAQIGYQKAARMLLLGERLSATDALAMGLIGEVLPRNALLERSLGIAQQMAKKPSVAMRETKRLMKRQLESPAKRIEVENEAFAQALKSPEAMEAMDAFLEKRKPDFRQCD